MVITSGPIHLGSTSVLLVAGPMQEQEVQGQNHCFRPQLDSVTTDLSQSLLFLLVDLLGKIISFLSAIFPCFLFYQYFLVLLKTLNFLNQNR